MKNSHGSSSTIAIISLILISLAAAGWYFYFTEVEINRSLTKDSRAQQEASNLKLEKLQSTINLQRETRGVWQDRLVSQKQSQDDLAALMRIIREEKEAMEVAMQQEARKVILITADLETELAIQQTMQNILHDEIALIKGDKLRLQNQLDQARKTQFELTASLEKSGADNKAMEINIQEALRELQSANEELQAELLHREATLHSLSDEIVTFSAENKRLQNQLEQEKESRKNIGMLLEKNSAENTAMEADLQAALTGLEFTNAKLLHHEATLLSQSDDIATVRAENSRLRNQLEQEIESRKKIGILLEKTTAEKTAIETNLQQQVKRVTLTTAELQAELTKRQTAQKSLRNEITSISGEKSRLLNDLEQEQKSKLYIADLKSRLELELNESRVEISQLKNQMTVIKLTSEVLFSSGSAQLKPDGEKVLSIIADALNTYPDRAISVEGHTDDLPINKNSFYRSNWELSTARGLAAVYYFQQNSQVDPERLKVVGHGQYQPVSSNDTPEGRQRNRRIEIRLLPLETVGMAQN